MVAFAYTHNTIEGGKVKVFDFHFGRGYAAAFCLSDIRGAYRSTV